MAVEPYREGDLMLSAIQSGVATPSFLSAATPLRILLPGAAGLVLWEIFARLAAPLWLGHPLDPTALIEMTLGVAGAPALLLHLLIGLVVFPAGFALLVRPVAGRIAPGLGWPVAGIAYAAVLWVYGMASLLGGAPPFLDFGAVAWSSLLGHLLLGLGIAAAAVHLAEGAR